LKKDGDRRAPLPKPGIWSNCCGVNPQTEITERFVFRTKNAIGDADKLLLDKGLDPEFAESLQLARDSTSFHLDRGNARQVFDELNILIDRLWEEHRRKAAG